MAIIAGSSGTPAFGIGGAPPPSLFILSYPSTQKVNAGSAATYSIWVMAEWKDKFNLTVGLPIAEGPIKGPGQIISSLPEKIVDPLPEGVEVDYPKQLSFDTPGYSESFLISVKVSPSMERSTLTLRMVISGTLKRSDYSNQSTYSAADLRLYVEPKNTSLGSASTVFYEGFDRDYQMFESRDSRGSNGWTITSQGGTAIINNLAGATSNFTTPSLELTKTFIDYGVGVEHTLPRLNTSFILETAMQAADKRVNFTFSLIDSIQNATINAGLSEGNVTVQGQQFAGYTTRQWYKFRLEANATSHTFKWYLDNRYQGALPFTGNPDRIKVEISGSGVGTGYIDDIFLQKITGPATAATATFITTKTATVETTIIATTTTTQINTVTAVATRLSTITSTSTTTLSITATSTTTERVSDPLNYAWAVSATFAAVVLVAVLLLQRRTK